MKTLINNHFLILSFVFIIGIIHWCLFINYGDSQFNYFSWKVTYPFFDVIKQSGEVFKIPYHVTYYDVPLAQYGDSIYQSKNGTYDIRFFANGFTLVSPHLFLLSFFDVPTIVLIQILIFYSIGFWGIVLWIKKFNLSIPASIFLFSIWSFNGFITEHMGIGHLISRAGYLYLPMFFWLLYKFIEKQNLQWENKIKNVILFSLFIFFTKLNGNGQVVSQFLLVGSIVILFYPKQWFWYASAVILSFLMMIFYIVPTAIFSAYGGFLDPSARLIQGGYGFEYLEVTNLSWGFQKITNHILNILYHLWTALTVSNNASIAETWMWNIYISFYGSILLICCSTAFFIKHYKNILTLNLRIFLSFCIVSMLSMSNIYIEISYFIMDLINFYPIVDRRPSRFIVYPLSLLFLVAACSFDYFFRIFPSVIRELIKYISIIVLLYFLFLHSYNWFVISVESHVNLEREMNDLRHVFKTTILNMPEDKYYIQIVNLSYVISCIIVFLSSLLFFLIGKKIKFKTN